MIKPKALKKGATIGVVSPASPSESPFEVERAKEFIEKMGYKVVVAANVNKTKGFTAASEEERAADINEMFARDDIDAICVTQGGYGSAQLVDKLDYEMIKKHPKIFCGFSDITSLHLAFNKYCDMVSFHGPGMARFEEEDLTDYTKKQFFKAMDGLEPVGEIKLADPKKWLWSFGEGSVEAPVIGGNLTLITASLGTPYEIDCKDKILFIEDVDTEPWVMDHQLSHMRNAGKLNDCAGILVGECYNCKPYENNPGYLCDTSLEDVLTYYLKPLNKPVLYGLPLGHTDDAQMIYQDPYQALNPRQYISDIVGEPLDVNGMVTTAEERNARIEEALSNAGLSPAADYFYRRPFELSGGQRQRAAIAGSLIMKPKFVVADEPVSMLDASIRTGIIKMMLEQRDKMGVAYLFITHDLSLAWLISDKIAIMYLGKIMEIGSADQIIHNAQHPYSRALLDIMPIPGKILTEKRKILSGETPNAGAVIKGCKFAGRCPYASEICREEEPENIEIEPGHFAMCHRLK